MFSSTNTKTVFINGSYSGYVNSNILSYTNPSASSIGGYGAGIGGSSIFYEYDELASIVSFESFECDVGLSRIYWCALLCGYSR